MHEPWCALWGTYVQPSPNELTTASVPPPGKANALERFLAARPALLVALAAVLVYANSLGGAFVFDDNRQIVANAQLRSWGGVLSAFMRSLWDFQRDMRTTDVPLPYYRPFFTIYLSTGYQLSGLWPPGWHLLNVALHALASITVYLLLRRLAARQFVAVAGALVFALHPAHSESVAWISGAPDPLMACFLVPSLICYDKFRAREGVKFYCLSLGLFLGAVLCKETALALPLIVAGWELLAGTSGTFAGRVRRALPVLAPYAVIAGLYLAARVAVLGGVGWKHPALADMPDAHIWMTVPRVVLAYAGTLLWPFKLSLVYGLAFASGAGDVRNFLVPTRLLAACLVALVALRARLSREVRMALVLVVAPLLPVLNLKVFHPEYVVQDRYLYLSLVGFGWLIGLLLEQLRARGAQLPAVALVALALVLGVGTAAQNSVWRDPSALWTRALVYAPQSWAMHYNLGLAELSSKQYAAAADEFKRASALHKSPLIYNNLALARSGLGDKVGAFDSLRAALALDPQLAEAKTNLGALLFEQGRYAEASAQFAEVVRLDTRVPEAHFNLARARAALGDHETAIREYEGLLAGDPTDRAARNALAASYEAVGRHADAAAQRQRADAVR